MPMPLSSTMLDPGITAYDQAACGIYSSLTLAHKKASAYFSRKLRDHTTPMMV
jgi:hypothetical protein